RVEELRDARAQPLRRTMIAVSISREPKSLQRLTVKLQDDLRVALYQPHGLRTGEISPVGMFVVELLGRQLMLPEAAILHVPLELPRIGRSSADRAGVLTAKAGQRPDAGGALVPHDVVRIRGVERVAPRIHEIRQTEPAGKIEQHILKGPDVTPGLQHWNANGIGRTVRRADGTVEEGDAVVALQVGGVG